MNDDTDDEILLSPRKKHKMLLQTPQISTPLSPLTPLPDTPYSPKGPTTPQRVTVAMPLPAPSFSSECDMDTRPDGSAGSAVVAVPDPPPDPEPPSTLNPEPPIVNTTSAPAPTAHPVLSVKATSRPTHDRSQSQSRLPRPSMGPPAPKIASTSNHHPGGNSRLAGGSSNGNSIAKLTSTSTANPKPAPKLASIFIDTKAKADAAAAAKRDVDVAGTNVNANAKPREKIKARMRMREKPGPSPVTAGSDSAPPAAVACAVVPAAGRGSGMGESVGGVGRVTRSTSLKRKERGGGSGSDRGRSRTEVKRIKKDGSGLGVGNGGSARRINDGVPVAATLAEVIPTTSATSASGIDAASQASCSTSETLIPTTRPTSPPADAPTLTPASTSDVIIPASLSTEVLTGANTTTTVAQEAEGDALAPGTGIEPETETMVLGESSTVQKDAPADGGAGAGVRAGSDASTGLGFTLKMQMRTRPEPTLPTKQSSPTKPKTASRPTSASTSTATTTTTKKSYPIFLAPPQSRPSSPAKPALVRSHSESSVAPPPPWGRPPPSAPPSGSSLSTLANALEKLRMPPPMRPNTSMGTRREEGDRNGASGSGETHGDGKGPRQGSLEPGATATPARINVTAKSPAVKRPFVVSRAKARVSVGKARVGLGLGMSFGSGVRMGGGASTSSLTTRTGTTPTRTPSRPRVGVTTPTRGRVFRMGAFGGVGRGRGVVKASRKTSLPSVMASPVKGGDGDDGGDGDRTEVVEEDVVGQSGDGEMGKRDGDGDVFMDGGDGPSGVVEVANAGNGEVTRKGKEKEGSRPADAWKVNASRRASMASRALSMSLNSLPPAPPPKKIDTGNGVGLMGPPATPVGRSASSTYPTSTSSVGRSRVVGKSGMTLRTRTVAGAGQSAPAALGKVRGGVGGHVSSGRKGKGKGEGVGFVLEDCRIFVDVRTDDGDDAGALFVDMLKGMGAKIMTRVGPTCTHIVYKNGLMSTLTRYRLLNAPRPVVVGIAWVVECVEQKRVVEVEKFTIDLDGVNVAGANKRRRSMLPKQIVMAEGWGEDVPGSGGAEGSGDGDQSMEGSVTMMSSDDDLPPLERARRRQSMMLFNGARSVKG